MRMRGVSWVLKSACLGLLVVGWAACLPLGGNQSDGFVDSSPYDVGEALEAAEGELCRSTRDCVGDLRCVRADGVQFCARECLDDATCGGASMCSFFDGVDEGWCSVDDVADGSGGGSDPGTGVEPPDVGVDPNDNNSGVDPGGSGGGTTCGSALETRQFELLNEDRVANGLAPLECDLRVTAVALEHSRDMAERGYFDHVNPDGESPWDRVERAGIDGWRGVGENIAAGYPTPEDVQAGWMDSPGHRANILDDQYTHVGVGVYDDNGTLYWTQVFVIF